MHQKDQELINLREASEVSRQSMARLESEVKSSVNSNNNQEPDQGGLNGRESGAISKTASYERLARIGDTRAGEVDGMRAQVGELDAARVRLQKELVSLTCQNTELRRDDLPRVCPSVRASTSAEALQNLRFFQEMS